MPVPELNFVSLLYHKLTLPEYNTDYSRFIGWKAL
jgi:hypothetical protein